MRKSLLFLFILTTLTSKTCYAKLADYIISFEMRNGSIIEFDNKTKYLSVCSGGTIYTKCKYNLSLYDILVYSIDDKPNNFLDGKTRKMYEYTAYMKEFKSIALLDQFDKGYCKGEGSVSKKKWRSIRGSCKSWNCNRSE